MGDRLISADALQEWIRSYLSVFKKYDWRDILQIIRRQPVVDAVPVVRCKDCRFHERHEPGMVWCPNVIGSWIEENGYCSMGERREDA